MKNSIRLNKTHQEKSKQAKDYNMKKMSQGVLPSVPVLNPEPIQESNGVDIEYLDEDDNVIVDPNQEKEISPSEILEKIVEYNPSRVQDMV